MTKVSASSLKNINFKMGFRFFSLITIIIVSLLLVGDFLFRKTLIQAENTLIHTFTKTLSASVNRVSFSGRYHSQLFLEEIINENPNLLYIFIRDSNRNIIASAKSKTIPNSFVFSQAQTDSSPPVKVDGITLSELNCCDNEVIKQVVIPYIGSYDRETEGVIVAGISLTQTRARFDKYSSLLWLVGLLAILMSSILVILMSNRLANPVKNLAHLFSSILEHIPASVIVRNRKGKIYESSKQFKSNFLGDEQADPTNQNMFDLLKEPQKLKSLDSELNSRQTVIKKEVQLTDRTKLNYYSVYNFLIANPDDEKQKDLICTLALNIDEQKKSEENLRRLTHEAQKSASEKTNFLATMSHEMRTPLTSIIGFLSLAREQAVDKEQMHFLDIATKAGNNLMSLINDVLDYSKIESGKVELEDEDFDLYEMLNDLITYFEVLARDKGLKMIKDIEEVRFITFRGDSGRIRQVISNLIHNSIKFTERGHVRLSAKVYQENQTQVRFIVEDTGIGMTPEQQKMIFTKFFQADTSTSRKFGGAGLGLSICMQLVNLMNGKINLKSDIHHGTSFYVDIPLEAVARQTRRYPKLVHSPKVADHNRDPVKSEKIRLLVVDDEESNRVLIKHFLKGKNTDVTFAKDGTEAIDLVHQKDFDFILMDIQMPNKDGIQATKEIREFENNTGKEHTPVVAFTANVFKEQLDTYSEAGFDGHLLKPFTQKDLFHLIGA